MPLGIKPVRIFEVSIGKSKLFRPTVHHIGKALDRASDMNSDSRRGVVGGGEHHCIDKLAESQPLARLKVDRRALDPRSLRRDHDGVSFVSVFKRHERRHYLRRACHGHTDTRVFLEYHPAVRGIDEHGALRRDRRNNRLCRHTGKKSGHNDKHGKYHCRDPVSERHIPHLRNFNILLKYYIFRR